MEKLFYRFAVQVYNDPWNETVEGFVCADSITEATEYISKHFDMKLVTSLHISETYCQYILPDEAIERLANE